MQRLIKWCYKFFLRGSSNKVVAPPGKLTGFSTGRPIVVVSFPRSGTHLMIDAFLNNFPQYKNSPLYVDFDQITTPGIESELLNQLPNLQTVYKTHYPHRNLYTHEASVSEVMSCINKNAFVIKVERDPEAVINSYKKGFSVKEGLSEEIKAFDNYWSENVDFTVSFDQLTNPEQFREMINSLSLKAGLGASRTLKLPPNVNDFYRVGIQKFFTRLVGKHSPFKVNTTIQFKN